MKNGPVAASTGGNAGTGGTGGTWVKRSLLVNDKPGVLLKRAADATKLLESALESPAATARQIPTA
jgi:hypothetical protein